jgi:hypothetical protein
MLAGGRKRWTATALAVALALALAGCGGDDSTTATGSGKGGAEAANGGPHSPPSREFVSPGGDNSVQRAGTEGTASERAAASAALAAYLRAGAAERRAGQCRQLSAAARKSLEQLGGGGCAAALEVAAPRTASSARATAMVGPVGSLRIEGDRGFALYHGRGGVDYVMPMRKESGSWKVDSLAPVELP